MGVTEILEVIVIKDVSDLHTSVCLPSKIPN
jgi:hypothetical protein